MQEKPPEFDVGDEIEFKFNINDLHSHYYFEDENHRQLEGIIHGNAACKENDGVIKHIVNGHYLVSFIGLYSGEEVVLAFKPDVLRLKTKKEVFFSIF